MGTLQTQSLQMLRHYRAFNGTRLLAFSNSLTLPQQQFLDLLPLALHINHKRLPGFQKAGVPAGVIGYAPDKNALQGAERWSEGRFCYQPKPLPRYAIKSLFLFDGGVALHGQRCLRLWWIRQDDLSSAEVTLLERKLLRIGSQARVHGLSLTFKSFSAAGLCSGSERGVHWPYHEPMPNRFLSEWLYLDAYHLAGCYPLWWRVPPGVDYTANAKKLLAADEMIASESVDLGGVEAANADEFFSGLIWRTLKLLDDVYVNNLELVLRIVQAMEYPGRMSLAGKIKEKMFLGELDYRLYTDLSRLVLACYPEYIEPSEPIHQLFKLGQEMLQYEAASGVQDPKVLLEHNADYIDALRHCCGRMVEAAEQHMKRGSLRHTCLLVFARKQARLLDQEAGSLPQVQLPADKVMFQEALTLFHHPNDRANPWHLHVGLQRPISMLKSKPQYLGKGVLELLVWSYFNGLVGKDTTLAIQDSTYGMAAREHTDAMAALVRLFPARNLMPPSVDELSQTERLLSLVAVVNFSSPGKEGKKSDDRHVISDQHDPLCFGATRKNLVQDLELLQVTSWGRLKVQRFKGTGAVLRALESFVSWRIDAQYAPLISVFSFQPAHGLSISRRLEDLFNAAAERCFDLGYEAMDRFLFTLGQGFAELVLEPGHTKAAVIQDYPTLIKLLGQPNERYRAIQVEPQSLKGTALRRLLVEVKAGRIELFALKKGAGYEVFVSDERGSIYFQVVTDIRALSILFGFLQESARHLFYWLPQAHGAEGELLDKDLSQQVFRPFLGELAYYNMERLPAGGMQLEVAAAPKAAEVCEGLELTVLDRGGGSYLYNLYYRDQVLVSTKGKNRMIQIGAAYLNREGVGYELASLDAPPTALGVETEDQLQMLHYLKMKKSIEDGLRKAMHSMSVSS